MKGRGKLLGEVVGGSYYVQFHTPFQFNYNTQMPNIPKSNKNN
jgi:hypothetical protein